MVRLVTGSLPLLFHSFHPSSFLFLVTLKSAIWLAININNNNNNSCLCVISGSWRASASL
ncbi:hypothetical protein K435DRAFT_877232 [Dendrothele bispora CBS 962.96]|uniref:Uncharacterized protein n=1 Tax=Dendrothele bispora (strain CBS 962.96) TaxID=1314807 RepID=A0A4S8KQF1_DENBC|nr:hypothetical protein K435DRAFT_877232 [Dendrothele bispora CBS 962.96]